MVFTRLTWMLSDAAWASFELRILGVRNVFAKEMHTLVVSVSHRCNQAMRFSLPDSPRYLSALFPLFSMGIRYLWEDRALPSCCCGIWKKGRRDLVVMASKLFPVPYIPKTTEGLPEALLCDRADLWLLCLPRQRSWETEKTCSAQWAILTPQHSGWQKPFIWAPRYLSESVLGYLRPGRSKPFSAGENQTAVWHRLLSGCTTRHSPGQQSLIFKSKFFNILNMSLYPNTFWDAGTDEPSCWASDFTSLPGCHFCDYFPVQAFSPFSNKSLTTPGPCAGYVSWTVKATHDC